MYFVTFCHLIRISFEDIADDRDPCLFTADFGR